MPENSRVSRIHDVLRGRCRLKRVFVNMPNVAQRLVSICGPCGVRYKNMVWHELKLTPEAFKQPFLFDNEFWGGCQSSSIFNSTEAPQGSMLGLLKLLPDPSLPSACEFPDPYFFLSLLLNRYEVTKGPVRP